MINRVIVGIDGSEDSFNAYKSACLISGLTGSKIEAVFVVDQRKTSLPYIYSNTFYDLSYEKIYIPPDKELKLFYKKLKEDTEKFGQNCLDTCKNINCSRKIVRSETITEGVPSEKLLEYAREGDIIVIGQHGENKKYHNSVLGSTTEEIIRRAGIPVLVCPVEIRKIIKIACFDDGGTSSARAKEFFYRNIRENNVKLTIIQQKKGYENLNNTELSEDNFEKNGVYVRYVEVENDNELLKYIENDDFDLTLIGAHGRHKLTEYILGSHAVHLVRKSTRPLLIVN